MGATENDAGFTWIQWDFHELTWTRGRYFIWTPCDGVIGSCCGTRWITQVDGMGYSETFLIKSNWFQDCIITGNCDFPLHEIVCMRLDGIYVF
jgi:hypothetical protein